MRKYVYLAKLSEGVDLPGAERKFADLPLPTASLGRRVTKFVPGSSVAPAHVQAKADVLPYNIMIESWNAGPSYGCDGATDKLQLPIMGEGNFLSGMELWAEEQVTTEHLLQLPDTTVDGSKVITTIAFLKAKSGMPHQEFMEYYETRHAPLAMKLLSRNGRCIFSEYTRTFVDPSQHSDLFDYNAISYFRFWSEGDYEVFHELCRQPDIANALTEDESRFFDRDRIAQFMVEVSHTNHAIG